ncbi:MAG TPA: 30S ribosomal protein S9 [Petrotogaceae bacterium]|jgi:small subunit ribosomal protein S9|nr:30S ribosomal protein S9 [Petrotogaceae bacterium]HNV05420.1 30S ribosomal protein S9 [Petrotogaceae bacterium]HNY36439.1 30S ribosomal protein S9 [Petrotogaceae bacterium]HOG34312.1 30S ribosomal protein S9 [Petrotogaceae bacterium]HPA93933.1 30S ribosomal protein S9 [Petrotogaceae bacterium]
MAELLDYYGTGRRKTSIARVHLRPGTGKFTINGKEYDDPVAYFNNNKIWTRHAFEPLTVTQNENKFDVYIIVEGGGLNGQSGAVRLGVARALLELDESTRPVLKVRGMLTRDSRAVERKKYGLRKARKRPQFSKR